MKLSYAILTGLAVMSANASAKSKAVTHEMTFNVTVDGKKAGDIQMELWGETAPATVLNFVAMCEKDVTLAGKKHPFKDVAFHRVIPSFMMQGGDFTNGNGTGGRSIYGSKFSDENFELKHTEPGLLSMANAGPNTNGSQFFITYEKTPWLDGKHVVYGKVKSTDFIKKLEAHGSRSGQTSKKLVIDDCSVDMKKKLVLPKVYADKLVADSKENAKALSDHYTVAK